MLGLWRSHSEYQEFMVSNLAQLYIKDRLSVEFYSEHFSKLYFINLNEFKPLIASRYSSTGKPSNQQPELFRSFILMSLLNFHSIPLWIKYLRAHEILCFAIGLLPSDIPGVGTHYDFISRFWLANPQTLKSFKDSPHPFVSKPRKKLGKNQKQPPRHPGIIKKFVDLALQGKSFENRPEKLFQQIFAKVAVEPSVNLNLLGDTRNLTISGDGTCINTGGNSLGIKTCDCISKGVYNCKCHRRFSDPDACRGWDSYHESWFYGHCGYFLTVYNPDLKKDLPLYLRLVQAQRYDGVTAIVALSEVRKLYPNFTFSEFIGDGAHDNYPTYHLLDEWRMKAIISLNPKGTGENKYTPPVGFTENGAPICSCGISMIRDYYDKIRHRIKYRCPLALGKISSCNYIAQCSPSSYGRVVYVKPKDDLRLFTIIPRNSDEWKHEMKKRTSSERVNKRILEDYGLEKAKARGKKHWSWWTLIHSINLHLDAQQAVRGFDFIKLLEIKLGAAA